MNERKKSFFWSDFMLLNQSFFQSFITNILMYKYGLSFKNNGQFKIDSMCRTSQLMCSQMTSLNLYMLGTMKTSDAVEQIKVKQKKIKKTKPDQYEAQHSIAQHSIVEQSIEKSSETEGRKIEECKDPVFNDQRKSHTHRPEEIWPLYVHVANKHSPIGAPCVGKQMTTGRKVSAVCLSVCLSVCLYACLSACSSVCFVQKLLMYDSIRVPINPSF